MCSGHFCIVMGRVGCGDYFVDVFLAVLVVGIDVSWFVLAGLLSGTYDHLLFSGLD